MTNEMFDTVVNTLDRARGRIEQLENNDLYIESDDTYVDVDSGPHVAWPLIVYIYS